MSTIEKSQMFDAVINEFEKVEIDSLIGDDEIIHHIFAATGIEVSDLGELSRYLKTKYDMALEEGRVELVDKIEQLLYCVNFIFEAVHNRYTVTYESNYIGQYL